MTLTIEIPEELAARLAALVDPRDLNAFAVAALAQVTREQEEEQAELATETAGLAHLRPYEEYPDRAAYLADARAKASEHGGDPELVEALADGLADAAEGRFVTQDQIDADIAALLASRRRDQERPAEIHRKAA